MRALERRISGWGRFPQSLCNLYRPERFREVLSVLAPERKGGPYIARGYGRSYGDASLNQGHGVVLMERIDRFLFFEPESGLLRCEAGVQLAEIIRVFLPRGWFLPVTPGTRFCSVAACVACDVHGKNHHKDGAFSNFVEEVSLLVASGDVVSCSKTGNPDLFWATVGGMGLTGIILEVTLRLMPVKSSHIMVDYVRTRNLAETLAHFHEWDNHYTYSVAWLDCLARGSSLGRGLLMMGNHATGGESSDLEFHQGRSVTVPFCPPVWVLNKKSAGLFNLLYHAGHKSRDRVLANCDEYFYPLDKVLFWNRLYGRNGFVQYQCVIPPADAGEVITQLLLRIGKTGASPFLAVLKRMGDRSGGLLSFPIPGYTLAMDFPLKNGVLDLLTRLDEVVLAAGGRIYLAKDARLSPGHFARMYPEAGQWQSIKKRIDPGGVFSSDLGRRLGLGGC
ncbi:MAG: FAD-binding oxidoreductase [Peptococcaceae bacterium]|nr:FAD-binding oxidoreductase [Peptococcaceae bacterium]